MSSEADLTAIAVTGLKKAYRIYTRPAERLLQSLFGSRRTYGQEVLALNDVSFQLKRGQTVGIIGRNGSGKSTLLQIISGTLAPTAGTVTVNGKVAALLELGTGFNPDFTGRENIYLSAALHGLSRAETDARFAEIVAFADIGDFIDHSVKTYSSGMYVRLAFAVIIHVGADILIVDEALAVGDIFFVQKCMRFLQNFVASGGTLLFVSHDIASVSSLCDRAILLQHGRIVQQGAPLPVIERYLANLNEDEVARNQLMQPIPVAAAVAANPSPQVSVVPITDGGFGTGHAVIERVIFTDNNDMPLSLVQGGESVCVTVIARVQREIAQPIIGFLLRDRNGQYICGENTTGLEPTLPVAPAGKRVTVRFRFTLPILAMGDYSLSAAVGSGTRLDHVHHHWMHEAVAIRAAPRQPCYGVIGLQTTAIDFEIDGGQS